MNEPSRRKILVRSIIGILIALGGIIVVYLLWLRSAPGPLDFARAKSGSEAQFAPLTGDPSGVPVALADAALVKRGEYLARAANCSACHTLDENRAFAGGRAFVLPIGTIYSTNITADRQNGIGDYSDADFIRVMHKGIAPGGRHLYPAMPFTSYTYMTDADALAIKAYLFSLPPVSGAAPKSTLRFPFNQRWLMSSWTGLLSADERYAWNSAHDAQWNRGAYLAEALAHCGECHTPRTLAFSLDNRRKFAGATLAGWRAYNITADRTSGIGSWSTEQLTNYIGHGHANGRGAASGPMGEAVDQSLRYLAPDDVSALVTYLKTIPAQSSRDLPIVRAEAAPTAHNEGMIGDLDPRGKQIYAGACLGCHGWSGVSPVINEATLTGVRAVNDPKATNVVQIVLSGERRPGVYMPAFGAAYSNIEVAAVVNYVTARFGSTPSRVSAEDVARLRIAPPN